MLALFCGFFRCFRLFGGFFEANWFLTLIAFDKKDNAVPMQSGVRVFGRAETNYKVLNPDKILSRNFISCSDRFSQIITRLNQSEQLMKFKIWVAQFLDRRTTMVTDKQIAKQLNFSPIFLFFTTLTSAK